MNKDDSYIDSLTKFLITDVMPIQTEDHGLVVSSAKNIISDAKKSHKSVIVFLLPSDTIINVGIYVAACMEKVKVLAPTSDSNLKCLQLSIFPFVNLTKKERIILTQIIKHERINSKGLLKVIKNEGHYDKFSGNSTDADLTSKEETALRQIRRILANLERLGSVNKEKNGKYLTWASTAFGKLISE